MNGDFYIGYLPKAPANHARLIRRTVLAVLMGAVALAIMLVFAQHPFAASVFEYGNNRGFEGTIELQPYPSLLVALPGSTDQFSRYLLVAPGKHGADSMLAPFAGKSVKLQGQLIYRDADTMIEVVPGSISVLERAVILSAPPQDLGPATLTGEIVDTKCYLGVMNPGSGKVHRDCAARCLSGGIPPGFIARDKEGRVRVYLLTASNGQPLSKEIIAKVGEPITLSGSIKREGDSFFFAVN